MSNMSYCRFQNTLADLRDCRDWLRDNNPKKDLSPDEQAAYRVLVKVCKEIAEDNE